jgi:hypothetical protein
MLQRLLEQHPGAFLPRGGMPAVLSQCPGLSQPTSGSVLPRWATPMLRRSRQEAPLDLAPSERLDRLMEVVGLAYAMFEDPAARLVSWQLSKARSAGDLSGIGAAQAGQRWNHRFGDVGSAQWCVECTAGIGLLRTAG